MKQKTSKYLKSLSFLLLGLSLILSTTLTSCQMGKKKHGSEYKKGKKDCCCCEQKQAKDKTNCPDCDTPDKGATPAK